ncbi:MAG: arsenate reductase ArsC [Pseudolabrys sp.]|jgi:arsenate reductase
MSDRTYNVLFVCSGNSARSVMAEALLNKLGSPQFSAHSAGTNPSGAIHPHAMAVLGAAGLDTAGLQPKSWHDYATAGAPELDFVITVCDDAAGETCPTWPGEPLLAHWGIPDPARATGSEAEIAVAFDEAFGMLRRRIELLLALPVDSFDRMVLASHLKDIGRGEGATDMAKAS